METAELIPLSGIQIQDKTIALSSTRREVEALLGAPFSSHQNSLYYFQNEVRSEVSYD